MPLHPLHRKNIENLIDYHETVASRHETLAQQPGDDADTVSKMHTEAAKQLRDLVSADKPLAILNEPRRSRV